MKEPLFEPYFIILRHRRKELGLSVRELAARCGMLPSYIYDVEAGNRDADDVHLNDLLDALGLSYADIAQHDCRPPMREIRTLSQANRRIGVALREIIRAIKAGMPASEITALCARWKGDPQ